MRIWFLANLIILLGLLGQTQELSSSESCEYSKADLVLLALCMDDKVLEIDSIRLRVQNQVLARIEVKYSANNPERASLLRKKIENSITVWQGFRYSYCDLETIHIVSREDRYEYVQECVTALTKSRIEELRLLQLNI